MTQDLPREKLRFPFPRPPAAGIAVVRVCEFRKAAQGGKRFLEDFPVE